MTRGKPSGHRVRRPSGRPCPRRDCAGDVEGHRACPRLEWGSGGAPTTGSVQGLRRPFLYGRPAYTIASRTSIHFGFSFPGCFSFHIAARSALGWLRKRMSAPLVRRAAIFCKAPFFFRLHPSCGTAPAPIRSSTLPGARLRPFESRLRRSWSRECALRSRSRRRGPSRPRRSSRRTAPVLPRRGHR
jgi:hypothetical protein